VYVQCRQCNTPADKLTCLPAPEQCLYINLGLTLTPLLTKLSLHSSKLTDQSFCTTDSVGSRVDQIRAIYTNSIQHFLHLTTLYIRDGKKANQVMPHQEHRRCAHLPYIGRWAGRWIDHLSPWRMASVTPHLWLPSQPWGITALWPLSNYTAWWTEAHVCEQHAQDCYLAVPWLRVDRGTFPSPVLLITVTPPSTPPTSRAFRSLSGYLLLD